MITSSLTFASRLYYGSGERRWLASPSIISEGGNDSRPASSWAATGSPSHEQFSQNIRNPRRRPREMGPYGNRPISSEIAPIDVQPGPRKKTSSIWSPHLRLDHRASRYNPWKPPSTSWSADSGVVGKRNIQLILFVVGFIFPFGKCNHLGYSVSCCRYPF